ncbi:MAG TPA: ABC transporter ATP-binding protein [Gammaproteobacteria bacterium]|jgi:iron complex transport system ATP-binding protein|nr:ABC transporter ATP-binding protein [Gammaproteobacteria bacterium]
MSVLAIKDLNLSFGRKQVLFDISLPDLRSGDMVGLIGPNGAGKSTLLQALAGHLRYEGEVRVFGSSATQLSAARHREYMAFMPQSLIQKSSLLPYELLWSALRSTASISSQTDAEQRIDSLLETLGLSAVANQPLYTLSGGKRQLVGLALSLVRQPRLLLLDEPTSALDLHWRLIVLDYLKQEARQQRGAVILALHDLDLALSHCDRLVLMNQGRIVAAGVPREVLTQAHLARVYHVDANLVDTHSGDTLLHIKKALDT